MSSVLSMRLKKLRNARRRLAFYRATYGIKPPFTVLVDGTALQTSLNLNVSLKEEVRSIPTPHFCPQLTDKAPSKVHCLSIAHSS